MGRWHGTRHGLLARPMGRTARLPPCPCRHGTKAHAVHGPQAWPMTRHGHGTARGPARWPARPPGQRPLLAQRPTPTPPPPRAIYKPRGRSPQPPPQIPNPNSFAPLRLRAAAASLALTSRTRSAAVVRLELAGPAPVTSTPHLAGHFFSSLRAAAGRSSPSALALESRFEVETNSIRSDPPPPFDLTTQALLLPLVPPPVLLLRCTM